MKQGISALSLGFLTLLCGCTTFSNYETVTLQTSSGGAPLTGAQCELTNKKGTWIVQTPGSVSVHLGSEQLAVTCTKDGYRPTSVMLNSSVNVGALMIDGAIASTVSGTAWTYPQLTTIVMQPD